MKHLIPTAAAASALLLTACGDDNSSSASNDDETTYSVSASGTYTVDEAERLLIITPDDAVDACIRDGNDLSWKSLSPTDNVDSIEFELSGDTLVLYPNHTVHGDIYVGGGNDGDIEGSWTYTGCDHDRNNQQTTCDDAYKTISLSISKGKIKMETESLFGKYLEDIEKAGYTNSLFMSTLYDVLAGQTDDFFPSFPSLLQINKETTKNNEAAIKDNNIKIIETSKTSQTFSIGEKTYTFKVNKVELNYEKNGLLSADLSLEVSSGSTTCTGSYTQKVVNKDLCKAKPETDLEKIRNGFLPDSKRGSQSRVVDFYTVSKAPEFNNCLKSIALD